MYDIALVILLAIIVLAVGTLATISMVSGQIATMQARLDELVAVLTNLTEKDAG